jgi:hypothetical protein
MQVGYDVQFESQANSGGSYLSIRAKSIGSGKATFALLGHHPGVLKLITTITGIAQEVTNYFGASTATSSLSNATNGINTAASVVTSINAPLSFLKSVIDIKSGVKEKKSFKEMTSAIGDMAKSSADLVGMGSVFSKMNVISIAQGPLYIMNVVKNALTLIADGFKFIYEFAVNGGKVDALKDKDLEVYSAAKKERWSQVANLIISTAFHIVIALTAVFFLPIPPVAIAVLGATMATSIVVNHYMKVAKLDAEAESFNRGLGTMLGNVSLLRINGHLSTITPGSTQV